MAVPPKTNGGWMAKITEAGGRMEYVGTEEPYPWLEGHMAQARDTFLLGSDAAKLRQVHDLAAAAGCRVIVVHTVDDANSPVLNLGYTKRGPLILGTKVYRAVSVDVSHLSDEKGIHEGEHCKINFTLADGQDVSFDDVAIINVDDQISKNSSVLLLREYWLSKRVEALRPYMYIGFKNAIIASMIVLFPINFWIYMNYYSCLQEDNWLSAFYRNGVGIYLHGTIYTYSFLVYILFHCLGLPQQSTLLQWAVASFFSFTGIPLSAIIVSGYEVGDYLGDFVVIVIILVMEQHAAVGFAWIITEGKIKLKSLLYMIACSILPPGCWIMSCVIIAVYLSLLPNFPALAPWVLSIGFPTNTRVHTAMLQWVVEFCVEDQRKNDPKAVTGSHLYGQSAPIAFNMGCYYIFSDVGALISVLLAAVSGESLGSVIFTICIMTITETTLRIGLISYLGGLFLSLPCFPQKASIQYWAAPTCFVYLQMDMRYALTWPPFFIIGGMMIMRGLIYGNWTFEGDDSFCYSETVGYAFLFLAIGEGLGDIFVHFFNNYFKFPVSKVYNLQFQALSDDKSKEFSVAKTVDLNTGKKSPLLTNLQPMPLWALLGLCDAMGSLTFIILKVAVGTEALGGPCLATLSLDRVIERMIFHPPYSPDCSYFIN